MRIALFDAKPYDRKYFSPDSEKYGYEIGYIEPSLSKNTAILARGYDVVCPFVDCTVDRDTIDILKAEGIKLIAMRSAGFNNVDYRYAAEKGIPVVRVPAYSPYAVAEHSFALLLALVRKLTHAYVRTREFNFSLTGLVGSDLHGKTIGIAGAGKIGRVAIDIAKGFGMKVLVYDPFAGDIEGTEKASLERIMSEADIISLYCPLTESNRHMINKDTLSLMKPSAIVINTSRGALIDSNALLEALKDRKRFRVGNDFPLTEVLRYFRFPYGRSSEAALNILAELGLEPIQWDVVAETGGNNASISQARHVVASVKPGSILLFHANLVPKGSFQLLRYVAEGLSRQGYRFVSVGELLAMGKPVREKEGYFVTPGDNAALDERFGAEGTGR